jgi:hypothetical protein
MDDQIVSAAASKITYGGAIASILGWMTSTEFGVIIGAIGVIGGLIVNTYFKWRRDHREAKEHRARLRGFASTITSSDI